MKAVYIERHGGPEELRYGDLPEPVAGAGEVVVDIHAASVNGADWKVRAGQSYRKGQFPHVLGRDFSGVVSGVGRIPLGKVTAGVWPFLAAQTIVLFLLVLFPDLVIVPARWLH